MRRFLCLALMTALFISSSILLVQSAEKTAEDHIAVYYFHGNFRCINCRNIEQYTREAIEQNFQKELESGKLTFKVINVETKGNEHFTNDYQLYTKSVVLSLVKNGKEVKFDNLAKVWECLRDGEGFHRYIKSEIEKYIKEL